MLISSTTNQMGMNFYTPTNAFQQNLAGSSDGWIARLFIEPTRVKWGKYSYQEEQPEKIIEQVILSPNPVKSDLNIYLDFDINNVNNVRIADVTGREVYNNSRFESSMNLNYLTTGTYYLQIQLDDNTVINRVFVKE